MVLDEEGRTLFAACSSISSRRGWSPGGDKYDISARDFNDHVSVLDIDEPGPDGLYGLRKLEITVMLHQTSPTGARTAFQGHRVQELQITPGEEIEVISFNFAELRSITWGYTDGTFVSLSLMGRWLKGHGHHKRLITQNLMNMLRVHAELGVNVDADFLGTSWEGIKFVWKIFEISTPPQFVSDSDNSSPRSNPSPQSQREWLEDSLPQPPNDSKTPPFPPSNSNSPARPPWCVSPSGGSGSLRKGSDSSQKTMVSFRKGSHSSQKGLESLRKESDSSQKCSESSRKDSVSSLKHPDFPLQDSDSSSQKSNSPPKDSDSSPKKPDSPPFSPQSSEPSRSLKRKAHER
ncbi:hypothetical protein DL95DRAFT_507328 [Leptodontidium sp. 2 PMI_412]|nr:hypothetical protein DL95DRAFT_507328 [Leptodontidium sp. 2 PMI_412]